MIDRPRMVCRQASDPLKSGHALGYKCERCGKALQVSAEGRNQLAGLSNVELLCNACGITEFQTLMHQPDVHSTVVVNRSAQDEMKKLGFDAESLFRDRKK